MAPFEVLEKDDGYAKLQLHKELVLNHLQKLKKADGFGAKLLEALEIMWPKRQAGLVDDPLKVDAQLYDGFLPDGDRAKMSAIRTAKAEELSNLNLDFKDGRLKLLLPLYKARNFQTNLDDQERQEWELFRRQKLVASGQMERFFGRLEEIAKTPGIDNQKRYLLEELNLYAQTVTPGA
jgi:exodeoxyribonuclease-1